jgi:TRAP-type uncharacterized transport system substrate-binding protein
MRRLSLVILTALLAGASHAQSLLPTVRIASGPPGQTYRDVYATGLAAELPRTRITHLETSGSIENLDLLASGEADVGFAQADVFADLVRRDEIRYENVLPIGRLSDECLFIAYRKDGAVTQLSDLEGPIEGRKPRIAAGAAGSGARGTWGHLVSLRPGLAEAEVHETSGNLALNQLEVGMFDAVVWVTDPENLDHPLLEGVRARSELDLMSVKDPELEYRLPSGISIYEIDTVKTKPGWLGSGWFADKVAPVCT